MRSRRIQRREEIAAALRADPARSNHDLALAFDADRRLVRAIRKELGIPTARNPPPRREAKHSVTPAGAPIHEPYVISTEQDEKFKQAMLAAGYSLTAPSMAPGTRMPIKNYSRDG